MKLIPIVKPRGCNSLRVVDRRSHVEIAFLSVHPDHRNKGIGSEVIRRVKRLGRPIRLQAAPNPGCARKLFRFYQRHGFTRRHNPPLPHEFEWRPERRLT